VLTQTHFLLNTTTRTGVADVLRGAGTILAPGERAFIDDSPGVMLENRLVTEVCAPA
jgi:hypothetical protein